MALTTAEVELCNQSLGKIGAKQITADPIHNQNEYSQCNLHYPQTRNALLRSFEWNFAKARSALITLQTLTLDSMPSIDVWPAGTVITGATSNTTATILSITSPTEYQITYLSGDFTEGEIISDRVAEQVYWEGQVLYWEGEFVFWLGTGNEFICTSDYPALANVTPDFEWDYQFVLPTDYLRMRSNYSENEGDDPTMRWTIEGDYLLTNDDEAEIKYIKKVTDPSKFDPLFTECLILQLALKLLHPLAGTKTSDLKRDLQLELKDVMSRARTICRAETNTTGRSDWRLARYS